MSTTIDTFIYLKRDIEQSFQRVQTISTSSRSNRHELDQLLNHIACTLDDLDKVNRLLCSSSSSTATSENPIVNKPLCNLSDLENECDEEENQLISHPLSSKDHSRENEDLTLSSEERENFIRRMKNQFSYFKGQIPSMKKESQMEIIRLDQVADDDNLNEDQLLRKQDDQLDDMHHSIVSLKNLTKNINSELEDHIRVLDNLGTDMASSQNRVENLTKRTKDFLRTSDGVCGHMCLFSIAVILFFLIIILILFF